MTPTAVFRTGRFLLILAALPGIAGLLGAFPPSARADSPKDVAELKESYAESVDRGIEYLRTKGQAADGSYGSKFGPAITALVTTSVLRHGRTPEDPMVAKSLKYLQKFVREDGGIYSQGSKVQNYETCLAVLCFSAANKDGRYDQLLKKAEKFVKGLQWDGEEGHQASSPYYGGAGYGGHGRPDLSNTQFLLEALKATGNGPEDEAVKKALIFVSRAQNLETQHNNLPHVGKVSEEDRGGFIYTPANGGESQAGEADNGGLRSYASMTYAGLKSMIFAGVGPEDPRVKAAFGWIQKNYDLSSNPGLGQQGLYYYYHTFAKALDALGNETIQDASGQKHHWRAELIRELAKRQRADGSWANDARRWLEGDPNLATGYALLTLSYCRPAVQPSVKSSTKDK